MASRDKWDEDMGKLQKEVEQEGHNMAVQKLRTRQLEAQGIQQTQRRMHTSTDDTNVGLPVGLNTRKDEEWHEEKRPARARKADDVPRPEFANATTPFGIGRDVAPVGSVKHSLRGSFGTAVNDWRDMPQGMVGLEALERLNLTDVDAPSTSVPTMIPIEGRSSTSASGGKGGREESWTKSSGDDEEVEGPIWKETKVIPIPPPGTFDTGKKGVTQSTMRPVPGQSLLSKRPTKVIEASEWKVGNVPRTSSDVSSSSAGWSDSSISPEETPLGDQKPQFEPVSQLQQATRPLPEWKQGEKEEEKGSKKEGDWKKKDSEGGDWKKAEKTEMKPSGVGVRLGTGMGHLGRSKSAGDVVGKKPSDEATWKGQAMSQCSEWQGGPQSSGSGVSSGDSSSPSSDEGTWRGQAMGQCSDWQGGGLSSPSGKGTSFRVSTTLEGEMTEGSGGRAPVGAEAMMAAADLPGAPVEWQGTGSWLAEGDKDKGMEKEKGMGMDKGMGERVGTGLGMVMDIRALEMVRPEEVGHVEQEGGGRTHVAQH